MIIALLNTACFLAGEDVKAYGAGLLSSFGGMKFYSDRSSFAYYSRDAVTLELEYACAKHRPAGRIIDSNVTAIFNFRV